MFQEKYIIAENPPSMPGPGLIIVTENPFWVGKVVQFKTEDELASFRAKNQEGNRFFKCDGYRIGILMIGRMEPGPFTHFSQWTGRDMAKHYLETKILTNASYNKRYKETN